jgi:hypothetical protein
MSDDSEASVPAGDPDLDEGGKRLRICAWCNSICIGGKWYRAKLLASLWQVDRRATHTICPRCFEAMVPGSGYPGE